MWMFFPITPISLSVYDFLFHQTNFLLSTNSRCGWIGLNNRTMRRAFGPSQSHALFLSLSSPFCTDGWASSLSGSDHTWMSMLCYSSSVFLPLSSVRLWSVDSGVMSLLFYLITLFRSFIEIHSWNSSLQIVVHHFLLSSRTTVSHSDLWSTLESWIFIHSTSHPFNFSWRLWPLWQALFSELIILFPVSVCPSYFSYLH